MRSGLHYKERDLGQTTGRYVWAQLQGKLQEVIFWPTDRKRDSAGPITVSEIRVLVGLYLPVRYCSKKGRYCCKRGTSGADLTTSGSFTVVSALHSVQCVVQSQFASVHCAMEGAVQCSGTVQYSTEVECN